MLFLLPTDSKGTHHPRMYMYFSDICEFNIDLFHLSQTIDEAEVNKHRFAQDHYVHLIDKFVVPA
jgi:hypothetical protein